ncbi:MAG: VWA domain-containing protein [Planctomycetaceae bacterium]|nr:VWA domain-containing protein [Planctomycetaceae bacterium]
MSFLSASWLLALTGLLIPIVLHMQRRRTRVIDWAAMRFLQKSLTSRRRGLTLEQFLLLLCRCLLLAAFVAALARPWTVGSGSLTSIGLVSVATAGLGLLTWGIVSSSNAMRRSAWIVSGLGLLSLTMATAWFQGQVMQTDSEEPCDVVLIIDGSDSMGLNATDAAMANKNHFSAAVTAAERFLDKLPANSTATVLIGGNANSSNHLGLQANLQAVREHLRATTFTGGSDPLPQLIERGRKILSRGQHARQQIVIFTDNQWTNWQSLSENLATKADSAPKDQESGNVSAPIPLLGRVESMPEQRHNLAVTKVEIPDRAWRIGERIRAEIEVFNGGSQAVATAPFEIRLNDVVLEAKKIESLAPGLRQSISLDFTCEHAGAHILSARLDYSDDIPGDNGMDRAFAVQTSIPVLIVNGDMANPPARRAAHYLRLALTSRLSTPEMVDAVDLNSTFDFSPYQAIVLCDVPELTNDVATALGKHIANGAGLFLLMGPNCEAQFYNEWQWEQTKLLPAALGELTTRATDLNAGWSIDLASGQHPALEDWLESGEHDLLDWRATRIWQLTIPKAETDSPLQIALRFTDGQPFLVERTLGLGRVLMQTSLPDPRENNFINRVSFPVWMHLLTRQLADQRPIRLHQSPSASWVVELPRAKTPLNDEQQAGLNQEVSLTLRSPQGTERPVTARIDEQRWIIDLGSGHVPGHYQLSGELQTALGSGPWSLTVGREGEEADLTATSKQQLAAIAEQVGLEFLVDEFQLEQAATGMPIPVEWWRTLAFVALSLVVLEALLLQWVRYQRSESASLYSFLVPLARPLTWVFLAGVWWGTWLLWIYGWAAMGTMVSATFNRSLSWQGIAVATLSCLIVSIYWDGQVRWSLFHITPMKFARLLLVGLLGFVLLEPVWTKDEETAESRRVVVLWDRSGSMQLPEADTNRESIAQQVLWPAANGRQPLLPELERDYTVDVFEFAANARSVRSDGSGGSDRPENRWAETTDLSAALQRVLADVPITELSGIIVVTDGCDRSDVSPIQQTAIFADHQVPIHSIVIGDQTPIIDAEVVALQVPGQVFAEDTITLRASLKFDQLRGKIANVRFLRDGELLKTTAVPINVDQFRTTIPFEDMPQEIGMHRYSVVVDSIDGEEVAANNQREASVWVTNDRLRLLIVEQRPRWEFRYLKNLFAGRDRNVALQYVLLSPDRLAGVPDPFPMSASAARAFDDCEANRLPESEPEWLKFDVIVLGDIDPSELDLATQRTLQKFVGQRGGTLIVVAGQQAMPHRYLDGPLGELLPAQLATGFARSSQEGYRLRLAEEGRRGSLMQAPFADPNQAGMWDTLPILHWRNPVSVAKPGATVLAWADEDNQASDQDAVLKSALILWHRYGGGRVLQLNFDQTWRLRFWNGDEHHHRFWGRVMRWGTEDRLGMGTDLVRLGTDKSHYSSGDQMTVKVRLVDDQPQSEREPDVRLVLLRDNLPINDFSLQEVADSGGLLQRQLTLPEIPGRYRIQVVGRTIERLLKAENRAEETVFAEFSIDGSPPDSEANDIVATTAIVGPVAQRTGGLVLTPETAQQVLEKLGPKSTYRRDVTITPVWNSWPVVVVFFTLLIGEWVLRRWRGLI